MQSLLNLLTKTGYLIFMIFYVFSYLFFSFHVMFHLFEASFLHSVSRTVLVNLKKLIFFKFYHKNLDEKSEIIVALICRFYRISIFSFHPILKMQNQISHNYYLGVN